MSEPRLIDANRLINDIRTWYEHSLDGYMDEADIMNTIQNQPTAYDKERVLDEIHEIGLNKDDNHCCYVNEDFCRTSSCEYCLLSHCEEIVKKGGVE